MSDGHAESAPGTGGLDDIANFLMDNPETEPVDDEEGATAEPGPDEDTPDEANDQEGDDEEGLEPDDEADKTEPPPDRKIKVSIKGDDGTETQEEVSEEELVKGYHRQSDYTKKMQALSERETQAVQFLKTKHEEVRNQYAEKAEFYQRAVSQMAGLRSDSEMAQLAQTDPAAWVAENQRQQSVRNFLSGLEGSIKGERTQAQEEAQRHQQGTLQAMREKAWAELSKAKIDKPVLTKIYEGASKSYGFTADELNNVYDHRLVMLMRDATAYRELKAKAPEVTRKVVAAPRMPAARQATPAQERKTQALNSRFTSGKAKLSDLAAYLNQ